MNKTAIAVVVIIVIIGAYFSLTGKNKSVAEPVPSSPQSWGAIVDDQGGITVTVTSLDINLSPQATEWKFNVILDTHTVELDQDLTTVAVLVDDNGQEYQPLRWEGAPPGGHHREGTLVFDSIIPSPQHLKLIIRNIGTVERTFAWTLIN